MTDKRIAPPQHKEIKIWATGYLGGEAAVNAIVYPKTIVATGDKESLTQRQMFRALERRFPRHSWVFYGPKSDWYWSATADRFLSDGAENVISD